ncbi:hypothetical protein HYS91_05010 [Candidatus Daviesbacteria bacterium]|nr:hypothetical protein [Candidatus Daviesbacteria bacterium]
MKIKDLTYLSGVPIFIASLCCLTPVVLVLFGLSTVSFAAYLSGILDGKYRFAFILAGIIFLFLSLIIYFRKRGICTIDQAIKRRNEVINKTLLILIITAIGYYLFFDLFLGLLGKTLGIWR